MGRALAVGIARDRSELARRLVIADALPAVARSAVAETGAREGTIDEAGSCDLVCVAVKPGDAQGVLSSFAAAMRPGAVLLSVVAGWDLDRLAVAAPGAGLVRTMPNLAVRHGAGIVALATRGLDEARASEVAELLDPLGAVVPLPESLFAAATALAGSGPGLVAVVAEGLEEGAVAAGLTRSQARQMVGAVLGGTAALLADGTDPAVLRQRVSSPAGTTIAGVAVLERGAVRAHVADAVLAAAARAEEI